VRPVPFLPCLRDKLLKILSSLPIAMEEGCQKQADTDGVAGPEKVAAACEAGTTPSRTTWATSGQFLYAKDKTREKYWN
jgi:hypothetical protein